MSDTPHVPAAFINALSEEGSRDELITWLQRTWNDLCATKAALSAAEQRFKEMEEAWLKAIDLNDRQAVRVYEAEQRAENLRIGQEMFRQQTIRIRRAALGVSDEAIDTAPDIDTEKIVRDLQQRAEAMGRDAARYRFMRDQQLAPPGEFESGFTLRDAGHVVVLFKYWISADKLDAVIDAALASVAVDSSERER